MQTFKFRAKFSHKKITKAVSSTRESLSLVSSISLRVMRSLGSLVMVKTVKAVAVGLGRASVPRDARHISWASKTPSIVRKIFETKTNGNL